MYLNDLRVFLMSMGKPINLIYLHIYFREGEEGGQRKEERENLKQVP